MWFRRDLRLSDQPALAAAAREGRVLALFRLDDGLRRPSGLPRLAFAYRSVRALDADLRDHGGELLVRHGRPEDVVPAVACEVGAGSGDISADFGPYGTAPDAPVAPAPREHPLVAIGLPYAGAP